MGPRPTDVHHLGIGEVILCAEAGVISTVLGSCVSVCLHSPKTRVGGMIHYAHPRMLSRHGQDEDFRYGTVAIRTLVRELERLTGETGPEFVAKVVGGASEIDGARFGYDVGAENVKIARELLKRFRIPIVGEEVGGSHGRKVRFHTETNRLQVSRIVPSATPKAPATAAKRKREVLIVDDSKTIRELIRKILSEDPEIEIVGLAADAEEASRLVKSRKPDVITLDIHMPGMSGVDWLAKLLPTTSVPVVMISSLQLQEGNEVFRALELGAVDYIQKPSLSELPVAGPVIREKVKEASYAKVRRGGAAARSRVVAGEIDPRKVLAIGASTGGTEALKVVMASLPAKIPPTVIVQHIPPVFSKAFADRLNETCPFEVKEAEDGDELRPSRVLIAPGGKQMKIHRTAKGLFVRITDDAPVNRHKPSVDYLFHSVASIVGKNAVGVILTGMGNDGAQGLLALRKAGARTVAQDENTSVVYGMPKVAFEVGAVDRVAPLNEIAQEIVTALVLRKSA